MRAPVWIISGMALLLSSLTAHADPKSPGEMFYDTVKQFENKMKWPNPKYAQLAAKIDGKTGVVTSTMPKGPPIKQQIIDKNCESTGTGVHCGKPTPTGEYKTVGYGLPVMNGVDVELQFEITDRASGESFSIECGGKPAVAAKPGSNVVSCLVGRTRTKLAWVLHAGKHKKSGTTEFQRPGFIGAGGFVAPAVPVLVIYEPPMDSANLSHADYHEVKTMGSTVTMSFGSSDSTEKPVDGSFVSTDQMVTIAGNAAKATSSLYSSGIEGVKSGITGDPADPKADYGGAISDGITAIAKGFGSATSSLEVGKKTESSSALSLATTQTSGFLTKAHLGPGRGDLIVFLHNARLLWVADPSVHLALIGYDGLETITVDFLRSERKKLLGTTGTSKDLGIDQATIEALMKLDPFVDPLTFEVNASGSFSSPRFIDGQHFNVNNNGFDSTFRRLSTTQQLTSSVDSSLHVESYSKGFLSFMDIGIAEDKTLRTQMTNGTSNLATTTKTTQMRARLQTPSKDEHYCIAPYFDTVFGTIAYRYAGPVCD